MSELSLIIRTADKSRKAEITVDSNQTGGDIIQAAVENWALPRDTDYTITNVCRPTPQTLNPSESLAKYGIRSGETLEIQPVLVAGAPPCR